MPEAVDVGSVLGGRYKVTAYVLASADKDIVLDGVDQVLDRPVSILVASPGNASQLASNARELAVGERNATIQILDLHVTDGGAYLVTNRAPAADMLDLIVQQNAPTEDAAYIEPFFTDTLGSEIFGGPRSTEPETYDDDDEYGEYEDRPHDRKSRLSGLTNRFRRRTPPAEEPEDGETSALPPVVAAPAPKAPQISQASQVPQASSHRVPPPPSQKPGGATSASLGGQDRDRSQDREPRGHDDGEPRGFSRTAAGAAGIGAASAAGIGAAAAADSARQPEQAGSEFPPSGGAGDRSVGESYDPDDREDYEDDSDGPSGARSFTRVLVGVVMAVLVVVAVVFAATQLSSISGGERVADDGGAGKATTAPAAVEPTTAPTTPTAEPTPDAVEPVITGISRLVPDNPGLDAANDRSLPLIIDGNPSTYWGNQVYASETFGGLATNLALVVELEEEATISEVSISQLNGSGGSFTVLVNDRPVLEGAEQIARGGFTGPTIRLPIPDAGDGTPRGQYVIVNFTQLPRLAIQAQYPFGVRVAEISVN